LSRTTPGTHFNNTGTAISPAVEGLHASAIESRRIAEAQHESRAGDAAWQTAIFLNDSFGGADIEVTFGYNQEQIREGFVMAESESALLQRFVSRGDTGAFAEIVRRYAGLVYGTCIRVVSDADQAADATQETFFQLMKKAGDVRGSLAGWLHRVAVRKAVDLIRNDSARRRRENRYLEARSSHEERTWQQIAPHVDEALETLDEPTRALLLQHYLEGRSMTELASEFGLSRPTVSRRIESGVVRLRAQLHKQGILVTAAGLAGLLTENGAQSAPAALLQQLGKMALLGTSAAPAAVSGLSVPAALGGGVVAATQSKLVVAAAAALVVGAGVIAYRTLSPGPQQGPPSPAGSVLNDGRTVSRRTSGGAERRPMPQAEAEQEPTQAVEQEAPAQSPPVVESDSEEPAAKPLPPASWSESTESSPAQLDLSSPEATVRSFTRAIGSGDAASVLACFRPGGLDYEDMQEILNAEPGDPRYDVRVAMEALDPDAEMPILSTVNNPDGSVKVVWEVAFANEVVIEGHTLAPGAKMPMDALLVPAGDSWLIDGL
jgi:RNA polymerase sigma factor (sigma-70 family)